jgi:predicted Ser/Thr protein kinase
MLLGQKLGDFEIEGELGAGAMGMVYRARYLKNNAPVAIKIISGGHDTNPNSVARFERETAILKKLSHPNIVRLYATGRWRGTPFYVMEYVAGETLDTRLRKRGKFSWEELVDLGRQMCAALQHAHHQGIVHRDLKPANIMIMPDDTVKLMDFGIAKGLELSQLTATNCTVGTAAYMSPEQCRGERDLTAKSDLYALGVLFYELLTGRHPFLAETTLDMFLCHTEGKFERPSRIVLDIPLWLDTLVCQMLEKKPQHRPYDAAMVASSLAEVRAKVGSQKSAGVEVARSGRKRALKGDRTDKLTAETLRGSALTKRYKKKTRSLGERTWFQVTAASLLLLVVAAVIYVATRPPSAQSLFRKAMTLMESSDRDNWLAARDGPIRDFHRYYAGLQTPESMKIQAWSDQIDLDQTERQLRNRMRMKMTAEDNAERLAQTATRSEQAGELSLAAESWGKIGQQPESKEPAGHGWQLLADRRLADLRECDRQEGLLKARLDQSRRRDGPAPPGRDPDREAYRAIRAEQFGDASMALSSWQKIKGTTDESSPDRVWYLLSLKKINEMSPKAWRGREEKDARKSLIRDKLSQAAETRKNAPTLARSIYQDIAALYSQSADPVAAGDAALAQKALEELDRDLAGATAGAGKK